MKKMIAAALVLFAFVAAISVGQLYNDSDLNLTETNDSFGVNETNETMNDTNVTMDANETNVSMNDTDDDFGDEVNDTDDQDNQTGVTIIERKNFIVNENIINNQNILEVIQQVNLNRNTNIEEVISQQENITIEETSEEAYGSLDIKEGYPKGRDYVFECDVDGFEPTMYSWFFGDSKYLINVSNSDVYHRYDITGDTTVLCVATDGDETVVNTLFINIQPVEDSDDDFGAPADGFDCQEAADFMGAVAVQRNDVCSLIVYNNNNLQLNGSASDFMLLNSVVEIRGMESGNVTALGKFAVDADELSDAVSKVSDYGWMFGMVHPSGFGEEPELAYVSWSTEGDLDMILNQAKSVVS